MNGATRTGSGGKRNVGRTRWLVLTPIVGLALIVTGVIALEAAHPQRDPSGMAVDGVPDLATDEVRTCDPRDEATVQEIRDALPRHGRVASSQVVACPRAFDGLEVSYAGEVVGELLPRDGGVWAQINDDAYAFDTGPLVGHREHAGFNSGLSVWLPDGVHDPIDGVGRPAVRGDVVLVTGTLLRADPDDGGGITIRAEDLQVLAPSTAVDVPLHGTQAIVAALLLVAAAAAMVWARRRAS